MVLGAIPVRRSSVASSHRSLTLAGGVHGVTLTTARPLARGTYRHKVVVAAMRRTLIPAASLRDGCLFPAGSRIPAPSSWRSAVPVLPRL